MAYHLLKNESVIAGIKRMAREQIDRGISEIDDERIETYETVHQVRKRCKKVRAILRLVRPRFDGDYGEENALYRDAARSLSGIRDARSRIECYDKLMDHFQDQVDGTAFASIRRELTQRSDRKEPLEGRLTAFQEEILKGRSRVTAWSLQGEDFDSFSGGLGKTYRRGKRAMRAAYENPTPENFHEWRKRAKYHWYHIRMLRDMWGPVLRRRRNEIDRLGDDLGDHHDLSILRKTIFSDPEQFGDKRTIQALTALIDRRRAELEKRARPLGLRIFAENPKRFLQRMQVYWEAWRAETKSKAA